MEWNNQKIKKYAKQIIGFYLEVKMGAKPFLHLK